MLQSSRHTWPNGNFATDSDVKRVVHHLVRGRSFQALDLLLGAVERPSVNCDGFVDSLTPAALASFAKQCVKDLFDEVKSTREPLDEDVSEWLLEGDQHAMKLALNPPRPGVMAQVNIGIALFKAALRQGHWHVPALAKFAHPKEMDLSRCSTSESSHHSIPVKCLMVLLCQQVAGNRITLCWASGPGLISDRSP